MFKSKKENLINRIPSKQIEKFFFFHFKRPYEENEWTNYIKYLQTTYPTNDLHVECIFQKKSQN